MRPVPRYIVQQLRLGILAVAFETRALNFCVVFENIITNQTKKLVCRLRISLEKSYQTWRRDKARRTSNDQLAEAKYTCILIKIFLYAVYSLI